MIWDFEGQPLNLEAAAQDALEWLEILYSQQPHLDHKSYRALRRCIEKLKLFLEEEKPNDPRTV